jgi:TatD DNase family protein
LRLVDTHAHLHHEGLSHRVDDVLAAATTAGVEIIINVGVDHNDSRQAVELAERYPNLYATIGLHPHDAKLGLPALESLALILAGHQAQSDKIVAIGECGLDYFKNFSSKQDQEYAFRFQIELALEHELPMVWHVRNAFDDFFKITGEYRDLQGIVHCFTSTADNIEKAVDRGYLIAFNGIMTFTKDTEQLNAAKACPLDSMVLETDCPFLSPAPLRGQVNEPANIRLVAEFLAELRGQPVDEVASATTSNARQLFGL